MTAAQANKPEPSLPSIMIQTPRGEVECSISGAGTPVLLLHGGMGGYDQGVLLGKGALGEGYQYIAVSRPGYLRTPLSLGKSPDEQADLCAKVLDALHVRRAAVIAVSGGGQCALQLALRHPHRCAALVMLAACSAQLRERVPLRYYMMKTMAHIGPLAASMKNRSVNHPEEMAKRSIPDEQLRVRTLNDPEAGPLLKALEVSIFENITQRLAGCDNDIKNARSVFNYPVASLSVPLLVIHGTDDEAIPFEQAQNLVARVPGSEFMKVEGGRHTVLFTHLHEVRAKIRDFLGKHPVE